MTPDKIEEAFNKWWATHALAGLESIETRDQFEAWQACAEWMLSQADSDFNDYYYNSEIFKHHEDTARAAFIAARLSSAKEIEQAKKDFQYLSDLHSVLSKKNEENENKLVRQSIHLNQMSEKIAEKDARITALELETKSLLEILISEGLQHKHQARIERIFEESDQLASKKEST